MAPDLEQQRAHEEREAGEPGEVLLQSTFGPREFLDRWEQLLKKHSIACQCYPHSITDLSRIKMAIVFDPPAGLLAQCPNLQVIHSMGAGVSPGMLADDICPAQLPLLRVVDPLMAQRMATFCMWAVINLQRKCDAYLAAQQACSWAQGKAVESFQQRDNAEVHVGIMGAGHMGSATIRLLLAAGHNVSAWTRTPRTLPPGVKGYCGQDQLQAFAAQADIVICLVPLTPSTRGIMDATFFGWLPRGAAIINVSRGAHVVEPDLLAALDSGHLSAAVLDVFEKEPLPPESPLWRHPRVRVFPHVSGITNLPNAAEQMARVWAAVQAGQPLPQGLEIDRSRGY